LNLDGTSESFNGAQKLNEKGISDSLDFLAVKLPEEGTEEANQISIIYILHLG